MFGTFIREPLANGLVALYNTIAFQDLGLAIILLTIAIRIVFYPLFHKGAKQQAIMQKLQPKIKEIQAKHKKDPQRQTQEMMALYKEHKVNPFSSIFFLIVQIPVLIALYNIFRQSFSAENFNGLLYSFVSLPEAFHETLLGLINLHEPSILMVGLAAIAQFFQGRLALKGHEHPKGMELSPTERMARNMTVVGPILTVMIFFRLPAAVGLYWLTTSIFSVGQQFIVNKHVHGSKQSTTTMEGISHGTGGENGVSGSQS